MSDSSTKPYLIRALHEWCSDQGFTPYLAVAVDANTQVPRGYVKDGEIVLNVSLTATNRLSLGNEFVEFEARFGGAAQQIMIPIANVRAIYAKENGQGMAFELETAPKAPVTSTSADPVMHTEPTQGKARKKHGLSLASSDGVEVQATPEAEPNPDPEPPAAPSGKPKLTRIK
jgi:stringent starvation protein B